MSCSAVVGVVVRVVWSVLVVAAVVVVAVVAAALNFLWWYWWWRWCCGGIGSAAKGNGGVEPLVAVSGSAERWRKGQSGDHPCLWSPSPKKLCEATRGTVSSCSACVF